MTHRIQAAAVTGFLLLLLAGCAPRPTLHVGQLEGRADSTLLAGLVVETLRQAGARAIPVDCPDLATCGRRLQAGDIDLLPDYSGSARAFFSSTVVQDGSPEAVQRALGSIGMTVTPGLGFSAPYVLLMNSPDAAAGGITSIEDLAGMEDLRFAVPPGYTRQPGDGLLGLASRYGLDIRPVAVEEIAAPADRIAQLLAGRVDVMVMRAPYARTDLGLTALRDTLDFYPRYEAIVVLGTMSQSAREFVMTTLQPLYGELKADEMVTAIREVALQGRDAPSVARRVLEARGIIEADAPTVRRPEVIVAYTGPESLSPLDDRATLILRRAYPERPVIMRPVAAPIDVLNVGRADLALVHTSDFFELTPEGLYLGRDNRAEAIAAIGRRHFVLLTREDAPPGSDPLDGWLGVPPAWTAAGKVAARMLFLTGHLPDRHAAGPSLIQAVRAGELDAAIVMLDADTRAVLQSLPPEAAGLHVQGLAGPLARPPFFMNQVRLPASEVPGAGEAMDTFSMQVLLAGPAPRGRTGPVHGGPASAVGTRNLPVPLREAEAIAAASDVPEVPDPVLPSFQNRQPESPAGIGESAWMETLLIIAGIAFMGWAGWLLAQPSGRGSPPR